jgi:hypothetical protein
VPLDREQQFFRLIIEPINKLLVAMGYPELTAILTRKVEIIKKKRGVTKIKEKSPTDHQKTQTEHQENKIEEVILFHYEVSYSQKNNEYYV